MLKKECYKLGEWLSACSTLVCDREYGIVTLSGSNGWKLSVAQENIRMAINESSLATAVQEIIFVKNFELVNTISAQLAPDYDESSCS